MALRDIIDRSRTRAEEMARKAGVVANRPGHVGDGFHLDGKDGRSPHLADVMPMIVARLEMADDRSVHQALGNASSPEDLPQHGRARRNAIRQMTVDAFRGHPQPDSPVPFGYTREEVVGARHSAPVENAMLRRLADPERVQEVLDSGSSLAAANWRDRSSMSNRLVDILQDGPVQDERIARESRHLGMHGPDLLYERFRHGPVARMDAPPDGYAERQNWIGEQLRGERAAIEVGRISVPRALDIAMMDRGAIPDHGLRTVSLAPPRLGSPETESALTRQRMAESAPVLSDKVIYDRTRNVPGADDQVIPRDPEERRFWTAVALEASYLRDVAGLPSAAPVRKMSAVSLDRTPAREPERMEVPAGHHAQAAAAWRAIGKMDVTI